MGFDLGSLIHAAATTCRKYRTLKSSSPYVSVQVQSDHYEYQIEHNPHGYNPHGYNPHGYNPHGYNPVNYQRHYHWEQSWELSISIRSTDTSSQLFNISNRTQSTRLQFRELSTPLQLGENAVQMNNGVYVEVYEH